MPATTTQASGAASINQLINAIPKMAGMADDFKRMVDYMGELRLLTFAIVGSLFIAGILYAIYLCCTHTQRQTRKELKRQQKQQQQYYEPPVYAARSVPFSPSLEHATLVRNGYVPTPAVYPTEPYTLGRPPVDQPVIYPPSSSIKLSEALQQQQHQGDVQDLERRLSMLKRQT